MAEAVQSPLDVFAALLSKAVRIFVVGGVAVNAHGFSRLTVDVDGLVATDDLDQVAQEFQTAGYVEQTRNHLFARFHRGDIDPGTVDVLLVSTGTMDKMWPSKIPTKFGNVELPIPELKNLFALKLHAIKNDPKRWGKDLRDIHELMIVNSDLVSKDELVQLCERFGPPGRVKDILQFVYGYGEE